MRKHLKKMWKILMKSEISVVNADDSHIWASIDTKVVGNGIYANKMCCFNFNEKGQLVDITLENLGGAE